MLVRVRRYRREDYGFALNLFKRSTRELKRQAPLLAIPRDFADRYLPATIHAARRRNGLLRVAEAEGRPVGFVLVLKQKRPAPWDETRTSSALVMELHVHPKYRDLGIGRSLLQAAEAHYRGMGFDWLTLGVFSRNAGARAFYRRAGYHEAYVFLGKRLK